MTRPFLCALSVLALLTALASGLWAEETVGPVSPDPAVVTSHAEALIALGDRSPGSSGAAAAADYIGERLTAAGFSVHKQQTTIVVWQDQGSSLSVGDETITLVPHAPNGTASAGTGGKPVTGPLAFVANGTDADLAGRSLAGTIVVLNANSGDAWLRCAQLGAKAAIFTDPEMMTARDRDRQSLNAALAFPRFLVPSLSADLDGVEATVVSTVTPESTVATTVVGRMAGTHTGSDTQAVALASGYESDGAIRGYSPGATRAWNSGLLLALAEQYGAQPLSRDLIVIFHGARPEFFRGLRQFLASYTDPAIRMVENAVGQKVPLGDKALTDLDLARWRIREVEADMREYLAKVDGETIPAEKDLLDSFKELREDPPLLGKDEATGEVQEPPFLSIAQIIVILVLSAGLVLVIHKNRTTGTPDGRGLAGAITTWILLMGWIIAERPASTDALKASELAAESETLELLGTRLIAEEAARKADALSLPLKDLSLRVSYAGELEPEMLESLTEELASIRSENRLWRDIQQKLGNKALEEEELARIPNLIRILLEGDAERVSSIERHDSILAQRSSDISSSVAVREAIGSSPIIHLVSLDFTDGGRFWSSAITGPLIGWADKLRWVSIGIKRRAQEFTDAGTPIAYDPAPYDQGEDPAAWFPPDFLHDAGVAGLMVNAVTLATVNDRRLKLGSPSDTGTAFQQDNFLAQTAGLAAFLRGHLDDDAINRAHPLKTNNRMKVPTIRVETPSEGSTTGVKGFPFPLVQLRWSRDETRLVGDVGYSESWWGDAFGLIEVPWIPEKPKGVNALITANVAGIDSKGNLTQIVATVGTKNKSSNSALQWNIKGDIKDLKPVVFEGQASRLFGIYDPRLLMPLSVVNVLSASRNSSPDEGHVEVDKGAAALFATNGTPLRVLGSEGQIGNRMVLLGSPDPDNPEEFIGLEPGGTLSGLTALDVAEDTFHLNDFRLATLRKNGINPESLLTLHSEAERHLESAKAFLAEGDNARAEGAAQAAWAMAGRVYPTVLTTANDVVYGLVVMLLFAIPFAMICERLIVAGNTIYTKAGGFAGFFAATFLFFFFFHPAFALATTPVIIFLAFAIITMSALVIIIIFNRFEHEMEMIRMAGLGLHKVDVSRLGTLIATVNLGISNMRRRPLRTFLTGLTVVLMTFILLTFASFNSSSSIRKITQETPPTYEGIMIRQNGWAPLDNEASTRINNTWGADMELFERRWLSPDSVRARYPFNGTETSSFVEGVVGIREGDPSGVERALQRPGAEEPGFGGERDWIFLPEDAIEQAGLTPGGSMLFQGLTLRVGILDTTAMGGVTHIDGDAFTPLAPETLTKEQKEEAQKLKAQAASGEVPAESGSYIHLSPTTVAVTHLDHVTILDGKLSSLALAPRNDQVDVEVVAEDMADQLAVSLRVGVGSETSLITAVGGLSVAGLSDVLIPLILGGLIIFSTMLGSVAERGKEIFIYASLGLAPIHIAALFLVEAAIYAVLGGLGGYMIAQLISALLAFIASLGLGVAPDLNYSSFTAVITILLVMATVLVSALYPAWIASKAANPGADTSFTVPEPDGDNLEIPFPFTVASRDVQGLLAYLNSYLDAHTEASTGCFTAADAMMLSDHDGYRVTAKTWLAPFDLGISQRFVMLAKPTDVRAIYSVHISLRLLSGQRSAWRRVTIPFLKELRKQFLVWRTLDEETTDRYRALGGDAEAAERLEERQRLAEKAAEMEIEQEKAAKEALKEALKSKNSRGEEAQA